MAKPSSRIPISSLLEKYSILTPTIRELSLKLPPSSPLHFEAGQFIILHVPNKKDDKAIRRAYSIASSHHQKDKLTLLVKLVPNGIASTYVDSLSEGDFVNISGPFGKLTFKTPVKQQTLFISTGAGISQHMSFLSSHGPMYSKDQSNVQFHSLIGVWNENEIFYKEQLEKLKSELNQHNSIFDFEFVLDTPLTKSWPGKTGFTTEYLGDFLLPEKINHTTVYLCGNPQMIKSVKEKLQTMNFPKDSIFSEAFV